jgi:hypothetical protein
MTMHLQSILVLSRSYPLRLLPPRPTFMEILLQQDDICGYGAALFGRVIYASGGFASYGGIYSARNNCLVANEIQMRLPASQSAPSNISTIGERRIGSTQSDGAWIVWLPTVSVAK